MECHERLSDDSVVKDVLTASVHNEHECNDCHSDKKTFPHEVHEDFSLWIHTCISCHETQGEEYKRHGTSNVGENEDIPLCADCHGSHDILPPENKYSGVYKVNQSDTCGMCHRDQSLVSGYENLSLRPIESYISGPHSKPFSDSKPVSASCSDCHFFAGKQHILLSSDNLDSPIHSDNLQETCSRCHPNITTEKSNVKIHK